MTPLAMWASGLLLVMATQAAGNEYDTDVCSRCSCKDRDSITCRNAMSRLRAIPLLEDKTRAAGITHIVIEGQPHLTHITRKDLKMYTNLTSLTIQRSGLRYIADNSFKSNHLLRQINLRHNNLSHLPWNLFNHLNYTELFINDNPLACNCSAIWLQKSIVNNPGIFGSTEPSCVDNLNHSIGEAIISGCEAPRVSIDPSSVLVNEGDNATFACSASGVPMPNVHWITHEFNVTEAYIDEALRITVQDARLTYNGHLECRAENVIGIASAQALLHVQAPARIVLLEERHGFYWCLWYVVTGFPLPLLNWTFDGVPMETDAIQSIEEVNATAVTRGCRRVVHPGTYKLTAYNDLANDTQTILAKLGPTATSRHRPVAVHRQTDAPKVSLDMMVAGVSVSIIVVVVLLFAVAIHRHQCRCKLAEKRAVMLPIHSYMMTNPEYAIAGSSDVTVIPRERVRLLRLLGEGAFSRVYLGAVKRLLPGTVTTSVAVKCLKAGNANTLLQEAYLLTALHHDNIVRFFGVVYDDESVSMIFEYMEFGDLNNYLRTHGPDSCNDQIPLTCSQLVAMSLQVAAGGAYLAARHFVHRDLAARNCLVGPRLRVKIGDFGLSRDVYATDYYRVSGQTMLPVRWMSPEALLYGRFTTESDVWSFGVVLWEIFTFGKQPWFAFTNHEAVQEIVCGHLLPQPTDIPDEVYKVILGCWQKKPCDRITMKEAKRRLRRNLNSTNRSIR